MTAIEFAEPTVVSEIFPQAAGEEPLEIIIWPTAPVPLVSLIAPSILTFPFTSNGSCGFVEPIPILPLWVNVTKVTPDPTLAWAIVAIPVTFRSFVVNEVVIPLITFKLVISASV